MAGRTGLPGRGVGMSLGTKMILVLGVAIGVFVAALTLFSMRVVQRGFEELEAHHVRRTTARVIRALHAIETGLGVTAADWALWDDAYRFVQDGNPEFVKANLIPDAFATLRIDVLLFFDSSGRLVWGGMLDRERMAISSPQATLLGHVTDALVRMSPEQKLLSGFVVTDGHPMVMAFHRILTSQREGPPRGMLVMAKLLDAAVIDEIASSLGLNLIVTPATPSDGRVRRCLSNDSLGELALEPLDEESIVGYGLLRDPGGAAALLVEARVPRDITRQGRRTVAVFRRVLVVAALSTLIVVALAVRHLVSARLGRLSTQIRRIADRGAYDTRVTVEGGDELSAVAHSVNTLLDCVVESRRALEESERRFRLVAESVADWVWEVDPSGRFTYASPAVKRILGYDPEEIVGPMHFWDLFAPEQREAQRTAALQTMARREAFNRRVNAKLHKDGRVIMIETTGVPIVDENGTLVAYLGADTDITERVKAEEEKAAAASETRRLLAETERARKALLSVVEDHRRAEQAIRESERRFATLATMAPIGIFRTDETGSTIYVNPRWSLISGLPGSEALGDGWLRAVHPDDRDGVAEGWRHVVAQRGESTAEYRFLRPDGSVAWVWGQAMPEFDAQGTLVGYVGAITDITERKKAEQALQKLVAEKDTLLREVHHRVKNNLQAIIFLVESRLDEIADERAVALLRGLQEQARAMSLVYEQVYESHDLSRVQMQDYLERLCTHLVLAFGRQETIKPQVHAAGVSLEVSTAIPCGLIVNELVTNSLKHGFPSGFRRAPRIEVTLVQEAGGYRLTVEDNGVGMPPSGEGAFLPTAGLRLVDLWARHQLGGTLEFQTGDGTVATIRFKG